MVNSIVFSESFPITLRFQGGSLCPCFSVILGHVDSHIRKLGLMLNVYLVVIPEPRLGLETGLDEWREVMFSRGFLAVDIRRQPEPRLHVHAPAVKMEIGIVIRPIGK